MDICGANRSPHVCIFEEEFIVRLLGDGKFLRSIRSNRSKEAHNSFGTVILWCFGMFSVRPNIR